MTTDAIEEELINAGWKPCEHLFAHPGCAQCPMPTGCFKALCRGQDYLPISCSDDEVDWSTFTIHFMPSVFVKHLAVSKHNNVAAKIPQFSSLSFIYILYIFHTYSMFIPYILCIYHTFKLYVLDMLPLFAVTV